MPDKLDRCVDSLMADWRNNPDKAPKRTRDGKAVETEQDLKSVAFAICRASTGLEKAQEKLLLEGSGPALIAAAVTAKPHLRQRGHEIRIVERDGKELVEVPLFGKGIYRHPQGKLVFNEDLFQKMIENHKKKVTDFNVHLDFRHKDSQGALAFLDVDDGGFLEMKDGWLYAYGPAADEEAKRIIESRKWRYSSPEFTYDYSSNLSKRLSTQDLEELSNEELLQEAPIMDKKVIKVGGVELTLTKNEEGVFTLESGAVENLEAMVEEYQAKADKVTKLTEALDAVKETMTEQDEKVKKLEAKLEELETDDDDGDNLDDLPEAVRLRLEASETRIKELEQAEKEAKRKERLQRIAFALEKAEKFVDAHGYGYTPVFLELLKKGLMGEAIEAEGSETIKLEANGDEPTPEEVADYYRRILIRLSQVGQLQMPIDSKVEQTDVRLDQGGRFTLEVTEEELEEEIKNFRDNY